MNEDGGEVTLAGHEVADEEEGESQHSKQGQQEGQSRAGNRKVPHHLGQQFRDRSLTAAKPTERPKRFPIAKQRKQLTGTK